MKLSVIPEGRPLQCLFSPSTRQAWRQHYQKRRVQTLPVRLFRAVSGAFRAGISVSGLLLVPQQQYTSTYTASLFC